MTDVRKEEVPGIPTATAVIEASSTTPDTIDIATGLAAKPLTPRVLAWRRFRRHKVAMLATLILIIVTLLVLFAGFLTKYGPTESGTGTALTGPTSSHLFGTNQIGIDVWTQVLYGGRISLLVGVSVALISTAIGAIIGVIAGYYGKTIDNILMRVTDLFLVIPLLVALIIGSKLPERQAWARTLMGDARSVRATVTILTLLFWPVVARIVRGLVLSLKEKEFVEAARAAGASDFRIMMRHLLPNCTGQLIINTTLSVAAAILTESALSFLGYGVDKVTAPTWGNLLDSGREFAAVAPWMIWFPGLAIVLTVLCVNFIGDGLRDALDPKRAGMGA